MVVAYVNQQDGVPLPLLVGQSPSEVVQESRPPPRYKVSTRAILCSGGSPRPSRSGYRGSVVSPPAGGDRSAARLGLPVAGHVRDMPHCDASPMLFPRPKSPGGLRGCVSPSLGQPGRVRVSALPLVRWVVAQVRETPNLSMTMVAPLWPEKEWFANLLLPLIVVFLVRLRHGKDLSVSTVQGSRSALNSVFALKDLVRAASRKIFSIP